MSCHHATAPAPLPPSEATYFVDDRGEAFARAVFGRFLRQATICRDIDDAIEHMHIVNDNAQTFAIRLGGEARIPVGRELILALASKKKELLALCESTLRTPRPSTAGGGGSGKGDRSGSGLGFNIARPQSVIFPPPAALTATGHETTPIPTAVVSQAEVSSGTVAAATGAAPAAAVVTPELSSQAHPPHFPARSPPAAIALASEAEAPKTVFVRKVDTRLDKDDLLRHFERFGEVVAISMNPTRGYAFVDFTSHDDVIRAVSATDHQVGHRKLEVEIKKKVAPSSEPPRNRRR